MNFADQVVVVTGGSRGLGKAICWGFARQGARVVIASRKVEACTALANEITQTTGHPAIGIGCHVGRWTDCTRLVDQVRQHFGRIDVLVNNAGMAPPYPSLTDVTEELFDKVLAVNLKGAFRLSCLAAELMREGDGGSIINVSSIAAVQPSDAEVPYALAKAGLNCLTVALARSFGPKVRVNAIMPGRFLTDIAAAWDMDKVSEEVKVDTPLGRVGEADEIVGAALYLAGETASYTTGAILKVDGGTAFAPA